MATIHISEIEAARDFAALLTHVRAGAEIVIESGTDPVAVLHSPEPLRRSIEECIALLPADYPAVIDEDFAADVAAAVEAPFQYDPGTERSFILSATLNRRRQ